jgi:hypothetical protein
MLVLRASDYFVHTVAVVESVVSQPDRQFYWGPFKLMHDLGHQIQSRAKRAAAA